MKRIKGILCIVNLLFLLIVNNVWSQLANSPWPMKGHDIKHTGKSKYNGSTVSNLKWKLKTQFGIWDDFTSPAVSSDGTIYVGCSDNYLYAINADGTLKWLFETGGPVHSSPAIDLNGTIYLGSKDKNLYAVNANGTLKWKFSTEDKIDMSSPSIDSNGIIYLGSRDDHLYAINADGTLKWKFQTGEDISESSPAIGSDGTIYVGSNDDYLYAINADGTLKWKFKTGGSVYSSPAVDLDGTIYVGSGDEHLYAIKADGTLKWKFRTSALIDSSPSIDSDGTIYVGSRDDHLYAINADGALKWKFKAEDHINQSSPAISADGTIYVGSIDDYLYAINADGTLKWKFKTDGSIVFSPSIGSDGTVYVTSGGLYYGLYALGKSSGANIAISDTTLNFGSLYVGGLRHKLLTIANAGDVPLSITNIYSNSNEFKASPTSFVVPVDSSEDVTVTFNPFSLGEKSAELIVASNDPNKQNVKIHLFGIGDDRIILYLQPDNTLNELPYDIMDVTSWRETHFVYPPGGHIDWKYPFGSKIILGTSYSISVLCGSYGLDGTSFSGEILLRRNPIDTLLASTTFLGGPAAPFPFEPQRVTREIQGINTSSAIGDTLIFRVIADSGNVGVIAYGEPLGQSYISLPVVVLTNLNDEEITTALPRDFELSQNYPNPFNPTTTIKYQLPAGTQVSLNVYNVLGELVRTLVNQKQMAGNYSVIWDGKDDNGHLVASGIYI